MSLYIARVFEDGIAYEYEYGNMDHALEHYNHEKNVEIIRYNQGKETILRRKINGKDLTIQN